MTDCHNRGGLLLHSGRNIDSELKELTVANIQNICQSKCGFTFRSTASRSAAYFTISTASREEQESILAGARALISEGVTRHKRRGDGQISSVGRKLKKRRLGDDDQSMGIRSDAPGERMESMPESPVGPREAHTEHVSDRVKNLLASDFMRAPTEQTIRKSLCDFIDHTGNEAVATCVCVVCARECDQITSPTTRITVKDIPHPSRLCPYLPHPKHYILHGMLLHQSSIDSSGHADICNECKRSLVADHIPKHALANNMWIGDIPMELLDLTLPERILVAKYYPAAYIIKLFPKKKGSRSWDQNQMHNGLKGNVSTYKLDPAQVATMIEGNMMPPPAKILSATIGITFVGPRGLPESTMPGMFRVRRRSIHRALEWLKQNNKLYTDIVISEARLLELPVDGIPKELTSTAKHSTDSDAVYREEDGYVPVDEDNTSMAEAGEYHPKYFLNMSDADVYSKA